MRSRLPAPAALSARRSRPIHTSTVRSSRGASLPSAPFVRCVPHETFGESRALAEGWADQVAAWIRAGKTPYFFMHAPDDTHAPENAFDFHAMVRARIDAGDLPHRPGAPRQQSLF